MMISNVSSSFSSMSMMGSRQMQKPPPPPPEEDAFKVADTNGDGVVAETELETLLDGINEVTGENISVDDAISGYDTDQDGALNGEELLGLMVDSGFPPPGMPAGEDGISGIFPEMRSSPEQAMISYAQNSAHNMMDQLLEFLQNNDDESAEYDSSLDITL